MGFTTESQRTQRKALGLVFHHGGTEDTEKTRLGVTRNQKQKLWPKARVIASYACHAKGVVEL